MGIPAFFTFMHKILFLLASVAFAQTTITPNYATMQCNQRAIGKVYLMALGQVGYPTCLELSPNLKLSMVDGRAVIDIDVTKIAAAMPAQQPVVKNEWCPGPILTKVAANVLRIGANWTVDKPCTVNFAIQPRNIPDPISVIRYTKPVDVTFVGAINDNAYVYIPQPTSLVAPKFRLAVGNATGISCNNECDVVVSTFTPRMFPASTAPQGVVTVQNGSISYINNIAGGERQITIGSSAAMTFVERDGVFLFELNPANVQTATNKAMAEQATFQLKAAQLEHEKWVTTQKLPPVAKLDSMAAQLQNVQNQLNDLAFNGPVSERQLISATQEFKQIVFQIQNYRTMQYQDNMYQQNYQFGMLEQRYQKLERDYANLQNFVNAALAKIEQSKEKELVKVRLGSVE